MTDSVLRPSANRRMTRHVVNVPEYELHLGGFPTKRREDASNTLMDPARFQSSRALHNISYVLIE